MNPFSNENLKSAPQVRCALPDASGSNRSPMKHRGIRDRCLPGFHFIPSGLLFLNAAWKLPRRPRPATRQAGRGFWRMVMLKQKCRLDERSVIRQTANSVRYLAFSRIALGHPGRCASGGSIFHRASGWPRAILPYGLTAAHAGMTCALDEMVNGLKILSWLNSDGDKA